MKKATVIGGSFYNPEPRKHQSIKTEGKRGRPVCEPPKTVSGLLIIGRARIFFKPRNPDLGMFTGETYIIRSSNLISALKNDNLSNELEITCKISLPLKDQMDGIARIIDVYLVNGKRYKKAKKIVYDSVSTNYIQGNTEILRINGKIIEPVVDTSVQEKTIELITHIQKGTEFSEINKVIVESIKNEADQEPRGKSILPRQPIFRYVGDRVETERKISDYLKSVLGGEREVLTADGDRIDLVTDNLLIEVKAASDWDNAIGQILKYKIHYPQHRPIIYLFDDGFNCQIAKLRLAEIIDRYINIDVPIFTSIDNFFCSRLLNLSRRTKS